MRMLFFVNCGFNFLLWLICCMFTFFTPIIFFHFSYLYLTSLYEVIILIPRTRSSRNTTAATHIPAIRRYFFQFIKVFAQKLNIHLEDVEKGFEEATTQANSSIDSCKAELRGNLSEHNSSKSAHEDLRDAIRVAHNLAYGKTRVHPVQTWHHMCQLLLDEGVQEGDFIIIAVLCPYLT